jgi:hypothetical protein
MVGWVGDRSEDVSLHCFADADFAGCEKSARSTSGVFLCVTGPNSSMPLCGISKRQSCVSHSTPEAEIVAADVALRTEGMPGLQLWDRLLGRKVVLQFHEDNQAMIKVCTTGKNVVMRHLGRTHRVAVSWLFERFGSDDVNLSSH